MQRTDFRAPAFLFPDFPDEAAASGIMDGLCLPANYFLIAKALIDAATSFIIGDPDNYFPGDKEEIVEMLDSTIQVMHQGDEFREAYDENIRYLWYARQALATTLLLRHTILHDPADLDRYRDLREAIGPCDDTNIDLLIHAMHLRHCLELQSQYHNSQDPPRLPRPFEVILPQVLEAVSDLLHTPFESRDHIRQALVVTNLDMANILVDNAVQGFDVDNRDLEALGSLVSMQGIVSRYRFNLLNETTDLDRAISLYEIALCMYDPSTSDTGTIRNISSGLLEVLLHRYHESTDPVDLDNIIDIEERLLPLFQETRLKDDLSRQIVGHLHRRLCSHHSTNDGLRSLQICEEMLPLGATDDAHAWWLDARAMAVISLSAFGGKVEDWRQVVEWLRPEVPSLIGPFLLFQLDAAVATRDRCLASNLEQEIHTRIQNRTFVIPPITREYYAGLDDTIEIFKDRYLSCPLDNCEIRRSATALVLVLALHSRYQHFHRLCDLRDALKFRTSSGLGPLGTYCLDLVLLEVSKLDLDPAGTLQMLAEAMEVHSRQSPCPHCRNLSKLIREELHEVGRLRLRQTEVDRVLILAFQSDPALYLHSVPLKSSDDLQLHRIELLGLIRHNGEQSHLDPRCKAEYYEKAIQSLDLLYGTIEDGDESFRAKGWRKLWAHEYLSLHIVPEPGEASTVSRALDYLTEFAVDEAHVPQCERLIALNAWFWNVNKARDENKGLFLEMAELALSLIEEQSRVAASVRSSIDTRLWAEGLLLSAAAETMHIDLHDRYRPLEILESGQSILWNQAMGARNSPSESQVPWQSLKALDVDVASVPPIDGGPSLEPRAIRQVLPRNDGPSKTKSWNELRRLGRHGPVVVLIPSNALCLALVMLSDENVLLRLPISFSTIRELHQALRLSVRTRADDEQPFDQGAKTWTTDCGSTSPSGTFLRSLRRIPDRDLVESVLEVLWEGVAEPVLQVILENEDVSKASCSVSSRVKPDIRSRQRMWWCCYGEFAFMPIHAAGIYRQSRPICVSDFYVSSFTPTLGALVDSRKRPHPSEFKVLAAVQPNPGQGWSYLPGVKDELQEILKVVPKENLIHLSDSNEPDFEGVHTSVKNVIDKLPLANVLHLACHGTQDRADPLSSGFILNNGERLTVEELMKHHFPSAHFAILSACHTASNDTHQPEESINLASAMLFLGFRSIIATKWPMGDLEGPVVAKAVYTKLLDGSARPVLRNGDVLNYFEEAFSSVRLLQETDRETLRMGMIRDFDTFCPRPPTKENIQKAARKGFGLISQEPILDSEVEVVTCAVIGDLTAPSLAHIVDEIARDLRLKGKVPAARWATFVHVGA